jgi:hypothetical protein
MTNDFSYNVYCSLLKVFSKTHEFVTFKDFSTVKHDGSFLILRHDIDMSPEAALKMAEIERELGVKAAYFILFSASWYNLFDGDYIQFPRKLTEMGHEVGLHYDASVLERINNDNPLEVLLSQSRILSDLSGVEIKSIAMHNPSISGDDPFRDSPFINVYHEDYTQRIAYFSDSCGAWRNSFASYLRKQKFPPQMHLLIHPEFWGPQSRNRWDVLEHLIDAKVKVSRNNGEYIKNLWTHHPGVIEHDEREL